MGSYSMSYLFNSLKCWVATKIDCNMKADSDLWISTIFKEFIAWAIFGQSYLWNHTPSYNGSTAYWVAINNDNK